MKLTAQNREDIEQYLLKAINTEGYESEAITDKERLQFVYDTFHKEYGFNIKRTGEYKAFSEWISGLPSSYNIEFMNSEILIKAREWGQNPLTEKQEEKIISGWFDFITNHTFKLFSKYKIKRCY